MRRSSSLRVAWYTFRATFARRWGGYLAIVLLAGILGGLAMGSMAGARRTQSSFPTYFSSTNPPELFGVTAVLNPLIGGNSGYDPAVLDKIAHLPHVKSVESASGLDVLPLKSGDTPQNVNGFPPSPGNGLGSDDGFGFDQLKVSILQGRRADPNRPDEIMMQGEVANMTGFRVGETIPMGIYTNAQTQLPGFGTSSVKPYKRVEVKLVGTFIEASQVVEDDVDNSTSLAIFTPAFTRPLLGCCSNYTSTGVQVSPIADVASVDANVQRLLPAGFPAMDMVSTIVAKAERAIKPESVALGAFGAIAALAALLILAQLIGRQLRAEAGDLSTFRALGAGPAMTSVAGLLGILGAVIAGSLLALAVAAGLSPLAPLGPVRPVDPTPGISLDWTVLGFGFLFLVLGLGILAVLIAIRNAPHRADVRRAKLGERGSNLSLVATASGLPAPAAAGIRFALETGAGSDAVPVRSAILGAALAIIVLVGTVTFGASLDSLVSHPRLYGWNWDYALVAGGGQGNMSQRQSTDLLDHDRYVRAWSAADFDDMLIAGQTVPVLGEQPDTPVQPPILSGHALDSPGQVVLGAITMSELHKHLGDYVTINPGSGRPRSLQIVGTATMPTMGGPGPHLEMGTGALVPYDFIPAVARNPFDDPVTGPETVLVDLRPGASSTPASRSLNQIGRLLTNNFNFGVGVIPVLHPAEIVNYRSMSNTPAILGGALGIGAVVALTLTLVASVRRRRRALALLKTLGFTRRQLASVVAWQSSVAVVIGTVVGIPVGIVVGRALWDLFANEIHAVPSPNVPVLSVFLIGVGALVLANLVAAVPGRIAARTPTALLLRAE